MGCRLPPPGEYTGSICVVAAMLPVAAITVLACFVSANQENHKAEISRMKQLIADLESAGTQHAPAVG